MKLAALVLASASVSGLAMADHLTPIPAPSYSPPAGVLAPPPAYHHAPPAPMYAAPVHVPNVPIKYEDLDNIHPCAVPTTVCVDTECGPVMVNICVPPDCPPEIKHRRRKIIYDYGEYEVEIHNKRGYLLVDYDD